MQRKCPNLCRDMLGNAPKSSWKPFEQYLQVVGDTLGNKQEYWRPFSNADKVADTILEMIK